MAISPKKLLDLLSTGAPVPELPPEAVDRARGWIAAPADAPAAEVGALPLDLALALVEAAVQARAPKLLLELSEGGLGPKDLTRAAKRGLHQLRSAGVELPSPTPAAPARPEAPRGAEAFPSLLTPMDGTGDYGLFLVRPLVGQVEMIQVLVNDERGAHELGKITGPRSQYRKLMRSLLQVEKAPVLELTREEAGVELGWVVQQNLASGTPFPDGLQALIRQFDVTLGHRPPLPAREETDERLALGADGLFEEALIEGWLPPEAELRRVAERLTEIDTSVLALSDQQKRDQIHATLRAEAARFFTPPMRQLYGQRLWMAARFLERYGKPGSADVARAEARRLFHGAQGEGSRFAEALFERILQIPQAEVGTAAAVRDAT